MLGQLGECGEISPVEPRDICGPHGALHWRQSAIGHMPWRFISGSRMERLGLLAFQSPRNFSPYGAIATDPISDRSQTGRRLEERSLPPAAFLISFALVRVDCPIDDGLHLIIWHFIPALGGIVLSACVGIILLRRRVRR